MYRSSIQTSGKDRVDYLYYNADIVNNNTNNTINGVSVIDPIIRFNETRDTPLIRNAGDYYLSIIRFSMDGPGRDLPILIPNIQEGTGQTNVNLTSYAMSIGLQQNFIGGAGGVSAFTAYALPTPRFIQYSPEIQNSTVAPLPLSMANSNFLGQYVNTRAYQIGQIVSLVGANPNYNSWLGDTPFYQPITPDPWLNTAFYNAGDAVRYNGNFYYTLTALPAGAPSPLSGAPWVIGTPINTSPFYTTPDLSRYWNVVSNGNGQNQSLATRYYFISSYQHMVNLWNITMYNPADNSLTPGLQGTCCYMDTYNALYTSFFLNPDSAGYDFPWPTLGDFVNYLYPPQMVFDSQNIKFQILGDSDGFGQRLKAFTPVVAASPIVGIPNPIIGRLFFNLNMNGLFANYDSIDWNDVGITTPSPYPTQNVPDGYVVEVLFTNKFYSNILDYSIAPYTTYCATNQQKIYWIAEQDYVSADSLWSPISSIVFTSSLIPVRAEQTGAPVDYGSGNLGYSSSSVQSAFQPIITDIALDTSQSPYSGQYRQYIQYAPSAEYRLSDLVGENIDIRNIDIQVYWKNRLDNQLYPITMPNLSSVSIKVMFRHKNAHLPDGKNDLF
jgi:hypothetical protein